MSDETDADEAPAEDDFQQVMVWGLRAIHEETRRTRVAVQWMLFLTLAGIVVSFLLAFGVIELTTTSAESGF